MSQVCILKLINGDELVGVIEAETDTAVFMKNPLVVEEGLTPEGYSNVQLTSYIPFSKIDQTLSFSKFHVIQVLPVGNEVERYYQNSIIYNRIYVTEKVMTRLKSVNDSMEKLLEDRQEEEEIKDTKFYMDSSKAIH